MIFAFLLLIQLFGQNFVNGFWLWYLSLWPWCFQLDLLITKEKNYVTKTYNNWFQIFSQRPIQKEATVLCTQLLQAFATCLEQHLPAPQQACTGLTQVCNVFLFVSSIPTLSCIFKTRTLRWFNYIQSFYKVLRDETLIAMFFVK